MSNSKGFRPAQVRRDSKGRFMSNKPPKKPGLFKRLFKRS